LGWNSASAARRAGPGRIEQRGQAGEGAQSKRRKSIKDDVGVKDWKEEKKKRTGVTRVLRPTQTNKVIEASEQGQGGASGTAKALANRGGEDKANHDAGTTNEDWTLLGGNWRGPKASSKRQG